MNRQDKAHRRVRKDRSAPNFSGQHLLRHQGFIKAMMEEAAIESKELAVDLGAGKGALTLDLAKRAAKVWAVENDPIFADVLREKARAYDNLLIVEKNLLEWQPPKEPFIVVSNIPYAITTPLFDRYFGQGGCAIRRAVMMIEWGAAKRFTGPVLSDYRVLLWRMGFTFKFCRFVPRTAFSPPPKVDSAIITIVKRQKPLLALKHYEKFRGLAAFCLKYPASPLNSVLSHLLTAPQQRVLFKKLALNREMPVNRLTEVQWAALFEIMLSYGEGVRWPRFRR